MKIFKSNSWQSSKIDTIHAKWVQTKCRGRRFESFRIEDDRYAKIAFFHSGIHERMIKDGIAVKKTSNLEQSLLSMSISATALLVLSSFK
jgi:hypothetical protein